MPTIYSLQTKYKLANRSRYRERNEMHCDLARQSVQNNNKREERDVESSDAEQCAKGGSDALNYGDEYVSGEWLF